MGTKVIYFTKNMNTGYISSHNSLEDAMKYCRTLAKTKHSIYRQELKEEFVGFSDTESCKYEDVCNVKIRIEDYGKNTQRVLAFAKLLEVADFLNAGWNPDWSDEDEIVYIPAYDHNEKEFFTESSSGIVSNIICLKSHELCEDLIRDNEHLLKQAYGIE